MIERVLFVDDEPNLRAGLKRIFQSRRGEWSMRFAASGAEALEMLVAAPADVVVSDMAMPEMNGEQTAQFIKKVNGDVPIILLTGFSGGVDVNGSDAIDVVLHKPITLETLRHTISDIVYAR